MCIAHRTINILRSSNNLHESFRAIITLEHAKLYIITLERLNGQSLNISQTGFSTLRRGCAYGSDVLMYWIMVAGTALGLRNAAIEWVNPIMVEWVKPNCGYGLRVA